MLRPSKAKNHGIKSPPKTERPPKPPSQNSDKERNKINRADIFKAIEAERERQDKLHPIYYKNSESEQVNTLQKAFNHLEFLSVLIEEVGEVGSALQGDGDLEEELIQVASVCIRWLETK